VKAVSQVLTAFFISVHTISHTLLSLDRSAEVFQRLLYFPSWCFHGYENNFPVVDRRYANYH